MIKGYSIHRALRAFPVEYDGAIAEIAEDAYSCCVAWFGPPSDPLKPYFIQQSVVGMSFCSRLFGRYYLFIEMDVDSQELLCFHTVHEMYHRVTAGRKGLAGEMWVQEMMASLSSHWFLRRRGFSEYAARVKEDWLDRPGGADVAMLRASRRRTPWDLLLRKGEHYSPEFVTSVGRIAYALNRLLEADDLRRIIKATTLEEWIASLPQEKQYGVCRVLEMATDGKAIPSSEEGLDELCDALEAKGNLRDLIAEFEQIVHFQPSNGAAFFYLGYANDVAEKHDAALRAYTQAEGLGYADKWLFHNTGDLYWQTKDYLAAAGWFQKAVDQTPNWARPRYSLGRSLNALDNVRAARQAWEKVLTLDDEHYAKLAHKALQENPLPADVSQG